MKDFFRFDKKYFKISFYAVISLCCVVLFYEIISNSVNFFEVVSSFFKGFVRIFAPFIYGFIIAYLLHKPANWTESQFNKIKFFAKRSRMTRIFSVMLVTVLALFLMTLFFYAIIPNIIDSISQIVEHADDIIDPLQKLTDRIFSNEVVLGFLDFANVNTTDISQSEILLNLLSSGQAILESFANYLLSFILNTGAFLYNVFIGLMAAIYINVDSKQLKNQFRSFFSVLLPKSHHKLNRIINLADEMFLKYLFGKALCSLIVGILFYISASILGLKYALLISLIVAVTNMIPFFGPFIGAVPAFIFALLSGVNIAFIVILVIIVIQQIDANLLAPKIIGNIVKLNGFWILVAIIICGKIAGIVGMILGIPIFAMLRTLIREWIDKRKAVLQE